MSRCKALIATIALAGLLAGCASQSSRIPLGGDDAGGTGFGASAGSGAGGPAGAETSPFGGSANVSVSPEERARQDLMQNVIVYFEFDSSDIRPEFNQMLAAHGQYLAANPNVMLRLEGHTDERGSREYNIGLGERRAQAVRRVLLLQGALASQLSTVSYGEERPAALGSDEEAYSLNRRVELVYR